MRALTALALFAASATSALAARACTSTHADDAETEGCFGWCSFAAAEEHWATCVRPGRRVPDTAQVHCF